MVGRLVESGASTVGFKKALKLAIEDQVDVTWIRIVPDAYEVRHGLVIAYEVEDTHRVDAKKLGIYSRIWSELDAIGWEFRLSIVDIRGGKVEPRLSEVYYGTGTGGMK